MESLTISNIKDEIADSPIIFLKGQEIYENGDLLLVGQDDDYLEFKYDGSYDVYTISVDLNDATLPWLCNCPYPGDGCKHIVAALLTAIDMKISGSIAPCISVEEEDETPTNLTYEEIKEQALEDRKKKADKEIYEVVLGDMYKGEHLLITANGKKYTIVMHNPETGDGHCSCPDYISNSLNTCKHLIFLKKYLLGIKGFKNQVKKEKFPYADIFWDTYNSVPRVYYEKDAIEDQETISLLKEKFDESGKFKNNFKEFIKFSTEVNNNRKIIIQPEVLNRLQIYFQKKQLENLKDDFNFDYSVVKADLYDYQKEGVEFGLFKKSVLIGDEMGLGKTLQAITLSVFKKEIFGFKKVLIITLASLKDQWHREIARFSDEKPVVVEGSAEQRQEIYKNSTEYFKITNYEAVLRDITIISRMKPDIIILDEAQRIKNFNTKTADAVKSLPKDHAIVLTGTPLENKLEDVYSIIQFLDPYLLSPLWDFAGKYFILPRNAKGKIGGYKNLNRLKETMSDIVIRRKKEEVLEDLPETVTNNYYIDLHEKQEKIHSGYMSSLIPILVKKFLTPIDIQRIQMYLLKMRMVCNSTYLIDKKTNISPKLKEFQSLIHDLVIENNRKVVVFSEWTTMTFLVAKYLSSAKIPFVELSGKVPVKKRQKLIDEFTNNPDCKIFLSTDAGGTGLNLQAADCVINFELPWNPAKLSQRTGRVNRIGQKSSCINVINLIAKRSIEEKIFSGIQMKTDLFKGVFEDGNDVVDFSNEKKASLINRLREMMGEEPVIPTPEPKEPVEIPEDTPYYLNPVVLNDDQNNAAKQEEILDYAGEENIQNCERSVDNDSAQVSLPGSEDELIGVEETISDDEEIAENVFENQSAEKIENVLNSGMEFIGGLLEMATGKKIEKSASQDKMLTIDKTTGEVTMKFKLPGL